MLAACSGERSQPMFGLTHTTLPRLTNRFKPPIASRAFSVSFTPICLNSSAGSALSCSWVMPFARAQRAMAMSRGAWAARSRSGRNATAPAAAAV